MNFSIKKDGDFYVSTAGIPGRETRTFMVPWKEIKDQLDRPLSQLPFLMNPTYFDLPNGEFGVTGVAYLDDAGYNVDTHNEQYPCYPSSMSLEEYIEQEEAEAALESEPTLVAVKPESEVELEPVESASVETPKTEVVSESEPEVEPEPIEVVEPETEPVDAVEQELALETEPEPTPIVEESEPEPAPETEQEISETISFPAIQASNARIEREEPSLKIDVLQSRQDYLDNLPAFIFAPIDEWCTHAPDEYLLKEQGDEYCMLNDWHSKDGYFYIDDIKSSVRYVYSDMYETSLIIKFADVVAHRHG